MYKQHRGISSLPTALLPDLQKATEQNNHNEVQDNLIQEIKFGYLPPSPPGKNRTTYCCTLSITHIQQVSEQAE